MSVWEFMRLEFDARIVTLPLQILIFGFIAWMMHRAHNKLRKGGRGESPEPLSDANVSANTSDESVRRLRRAQAQQWRP